jgi:cobalt-zinc-cadmium efflux system outer membrane protein
MKRFLTVMLLAGMTSTALAESGTLRLQTAIDKAIAASPRLASSRAAVDAAAGIERQAGIWTNPDLQIEAENVAGSGPYKGTNEAELTYSLAQKIELGGKRSARKATAGAERRAADSALQSEKLTLIRDVTVAYANVLAAQENLRVAQTQRKLAKEILDNVTRRVKAARDPLLQQSQAEVAHATAKLAEEQNGRDLQLAKTQLGNLLGGTTISQTLDSSLFSNLPGPHALPDYQARLEDNPALARFDNLRQARTSALTLAQRQWIPDPALTLGVREFRASKDQALVAGISIPLPVFDRNQGDIERARGELAQAENDRRAALLDLQQELTKNWQEWQSAHAEAEALRDTIMPSAEKALDLSRQGYERGRFAYLEILNAQRTLSEARNQYTRAMQRQLTAKADVERLTATAFNQKEKTQ